MYKKSSALEPLLHLFAMIAAATLISDLIAAAIITIIFAAVAAFVAIFTLVSWAILYRIDPKLVTREQVDATEKSGFTGI